MNEEILKVKNRRQIYLHISKNPGVTVANISQILNIPRTTTSYHLDYLNKRNIIFEKKEKGFRRYFPNYTIGSKDIELIKTLRKKVPRNIILFLCLYGGSSVPDLVKFAKKWKDHPSKIGFNLNKHRTTIIYYLKQLEKKGIVESVKYGNKVFYKINNMDKIMDVLILYKISFLPDNLENFLKWMETGNMYINKAEKILYSIFPHPYYG